MPDWLTAKTKKSMPKAADNNELAATDSSDTGREDEFLAVLDSISHQIPFVGFASVVGSLKALMVRCEEVKVVEREEMKYRIRSLGIALVEKLKEARGADLNQIAINAEIRSLKSSRGNSDLEDIGQMLGKMKSPKIRISVLRQSPKADRQLVSRSDSSQIGPENGWKVQNQPQGANSPSKDVLESAPNELRMSSRSADPTASDSLLVSVIQCRAWESRRRSSDLT
ncbi:hypothetical protein C8J56DRAFT_896726 [Mycena floridula]|nr:hypothetical protein C8J56DRAFT_896726 [Mycena floridula]